MSVPPVLYVVSFGYCHGDPPVSNLVVDVRWLPNPFHTAESHDLSGRDQSVQEWVLTHPVVQGWFHSALDVAYPLIRAAREQDSRAVTMAFGCQRGHHRSVAIAERCAESLRHAGYRVMTEHRDIHHGTGR
ncbi:P-loop ATPase protein family protein [Actinopolyspora alba]|uniref:P-loop ATPase protein family protein n=1 Tax=Actinopolyspora alba TaxID=673379 RepID=A0A1I2CII0_9ACTN|nr:RNase adapter RapZ [Actinopolyspora alba]SFE67962.1 P-loop ATPase protein family protein [Actinopolyspora alba]